MDSSSKKIKVPVSAFVYSQLAVDVEDYELKGVGEICNRILSQYSSLGAPVGSAGREVFKGGPPLQFNLYKENRRFLNYVENLKLKLASVCRYYFEEYTAMPRAERELFINRENVAAVKKAIELGQQISFEYKEKFLTLSPCFIANSPSNVHAYLVAYGVRSVQGEKWAGFNAYRISRIKNAAQIPGSVAQHTAEFNLSRQAEMFRENFDPFLCYGQTVTANLTPKGMEIYNTAKTNRPVLKSSIQASDGVRTTCVFQCSEKLAEIYFPQFLEEVEILEPDTLRLKFQERLTAALERYKRG